VLGLSTRLVFSTPRNAATKARAVTLHNRGSASIHVTALRFGGQNPGQFVLPSDQPRSFSIAAHGSASVRVRFRPTSAGNKFATLTIVNSSSSPNYQVRLRGVRARGTIGDTEPQLAQLMQVFGYTTRIGFTAGHQATTRDLRGDEVHAPYFVRANTSKPVRLVPIARYTAAYGGSVDSGRTPRTSPSKLVLYRFAGDPFVDPNPGDGRDTSVYGQNQKTFPSTSSGGTSFGPSASFGLYANINNYSDDRFNVASNGTLRHNLRVYPAKGPGGTRIANTWIVAVDVKFDAGDKNFDYQDQVMLLRNARPS
jgi:hypothetical protein